MLSSIGWGLRCWAGTPYKLAQSVPMLMNNTTMAQGAKGAYNASFRALGQQLVANGQADAYLRVGWEFNGNWHSWAAAANPSIFKAYFRQIVYSLRSAKGQHFRIVWNPAAGQQQIEASLAYPGDDVVDVIGLDIYNASWRPQDVGNAQVRWNNLVTQQNGLTWLHDFAKRHRKPIAFPEWGTGTRPDGHGYGDDPLFINNMAKWIADNNVVYQSYWDYAAWDYNSEMSTGKMPLTAAAFKTNFGTRTPTP